MKQANESEQHERSIGLRTRTNIEVNWAEKGVKSEWKCSRATGSIQAMIDFVGDWCVFAANIFKRDSLTHFAANWTTLKRIDLKHKFGQNKDY